MIRGLSRGNQDLQKRRAHVKIDCRVSIAASSSGFGSLSKGVDDELEERGYEVVVRR